MARRLRERQIRPWWDRWRLPAGSSWQDEIVQGLYSSRVCAVMVGPAALGDWAREEVSVALLRAAKDPTFRIFMVLLPRAPQVTDPRLAFLRTRTWVDLRGGIDDPAGLDDLVRAITGAPPHGELAIATPGVCPYRGLEPFEEEHAEFFFGRDDDVAVMVEKLRSSRFLAVLGPSGSGKSSLLRAGLVPALRRGSLGGTGSSHVITPGFRPLVALALELAALLPDAATQKTLDELGDDRRTLDLAVGLALRDRPPGHRLLLVVDQFEEVFTLCEDEADRAAFLANLLYAATVPGGRAVVVLGMRADFYPRCAAYPDLRALVADQQFLVGALDDVGLRRAIEEPARLVELEIETGLVDTIMADLGHPVGRLPLLEHVLLELWRRRRGSMLTLDSYVAAGRVQGALAKRADAVYASFTPARQEVARRVFLRLVQPGEGTEDTRRRAPMAELVAVGRDGSAVEAVVNDLASQRLLTVGRDEPGGAPVVDIAHEVLIRGWPRLRGWIDQDRDDLRIERHMSEAAAEWMWGSRRDDDLYTGARLAIWKERTLDGLTESEQEFVRASLGREVRERAAGRRRVRLAVTGVIAALTSLVVVAAVGYLQVSHQRDVASSERDVATSRYLVEQAEARANGDPQLAALLSLNAQRIHDSADTRGSLLRRVVQTQGARKFLDGHTAGVSSVAFSPDGRTLASGGGDGVMLWDAMSGRRLATLTGHSASVAGVAFSPDSHTLASAGMDGRVILWDVAQGRQVAALTGHTELAPSVAFSPDGRTLATGGIPSTGTEGEVVLWDVAQGTELATLTGHVGASLAFSPDGLTLAAGGGDGEVSVWTVAERARSATFDAGNGFVLSVAFSPDGKTLAAGTTAPDGTGGILKRWDLADGHPLDGPGFGERAVAFSPDGSMLAYAQDNKLGLRNAAEDREVTLTGHADRVLGVAFSPDGHTVATGSADRRVILWDTRDRFAPGRTLGEPGFIDRVSFSPDGRTLAVLATRLDTDRVTLWNVAERTRIAVLPDAEANGVVAFSPDGGTLAVGHSGRRMIALWDVATRTLVKTLSGEADMRASAFSPDGRTLAIAYGNDTIGLWDLGTGSEVATLRANSEGVGSVAFSPDGRTLASGGGNTRVLLWDVTTRAQVAALEGHTQRVTDVAFSPDGRTLASGAPDQKVILWDVASRRQRATLSSGDSVYTFLFSPDGGMLAIEGFEGVTLWDAGQLVQLGRVGDPGASSSLSAFSPDGHTLATTGLDGVFLWDLRSSSWRQRLCDIVGRDLTAEERATYLPGQPSRPTCG